MAKLTEGDEKIIELEPRKTTVLDHQGFYFATIILAILAWHGVNRIGDSIKDPITSLVQRREKLQEEWWFNESQEVEFRDIHEEILKLAEAEGKMAAILQADGVGKKSKLVEQ